MKVEEMFSRRHGFYKPKTLWEDDLPPDFLHGLKNVLESCFFKTGFRSMWYRVSNQLSWPRGNMPQWEPRENDDSLDEFFESASQRPWYELLDAVDFIGQEIKTSKTIDFNAYRDQANHHLELKDINWIVDEEGKLVKRIQNLAIIEQALADTDSEIEVSQEHLRKAWDLFNKRPTPDFANCVKEAVMAVESAAIALSGKDKGTLSDALKKLNLHPALIQSMDKLYAYRGDEPGVAHGAATCPTVSQSEAELILTVCAGLITFLKQHANSIQNSG